MDSQREEVAKLEEELGVAEAAVRKEREKEDGEYLDHAPSGLFPIHTTYRLYILPCPHHLSFAATAMLQPSLNIHFWLNNERNNSFYGQHDSNLCC